MNSHRDRIIVFSHNFLFTTLVCVSVCLCVCMCIYISGWPKHSFGFFHKIKCKNFSKCFLVIQYMCVSSYFLLCQVVWYIFFYIRLFNLQFSTHVTEHWNGSSVQFSSVQSLSRVRLFATPWIAARQASLSITNSRSSPRLTSIELVMPSSHLILCRPLLLLPTIPPSIRLFSNESALHIRWPKYWSFSFSISPSNEHPGLIPFGMDWLDLLAVQGTLKSLLQHYSSKHQFFGAQLQEI